MLYIKADNSTTFIPGWTINGSVLHEWYEDDTDALSGEFTITVSNDATNIFNGTYKVSKTRNGAFTVTQNGKTPIDRVAEAIEYYIYDIYQELESGDPAVSGWEKYEITYMYAGSVDCTAELEFNENYSKGEYSSSTAKVTADVKHNGNAINTVINISGTPLPNGKISFYTTYESLSFNGTALNPDLGPSEALAIVNDLLIE